MQINEYGGCIWNQREKRVLTNLEANDCNELLNMFSSISMMNHKPLNLYSQIWLCI